MKLRPALHADKVAAFRVVWAEKCKVECRSEMLVPCLNLPIFSYLQMISAEFSLFYVKVLYRARIKGFMDKTRNFALTSI